MSYPLIILGAGASFDYIDREQHMDGPYATPDLDQYRPPLLKDLFSPSRFGEFLEKFSDASALASDADGVGDFEAYLTKVQNELAPKNEDRYKQIISLRYYLSELFTIISSKYYRPKNYFRKIITKINDLGGDACFVNFNYDVLFETNLPSIRNSENIDDYINGKIKVIKMHGACDWFYRINSIMGEKPNSVAYNLLIENYAKTFVEFANSSRADKDLIIRPSHTPWNYTERINGKNYYYLPALAIPITTKSNYVCPKTHIDILERAMPKIDRILVIGWRANDKYLVELLLKAIGKPTPVTIVAGNSSAQVAEKLKANSNLTVTPMKIGFTDFVKAGQLEKFFYS